jgi:hypothetical protein
MFQNEQDKKIEENLAKVFSEISAEKEMERKALKRMSIFILDLEEELKTWEDSILKFWWIGRIEAMKEKYPIKVYADGNKI